MSIFAEYKLLSDDCIFEVDGKEYTFIKYKSEPNCSRYQVYVNNIYYYIRCYSVGDVHNLTEICFNQNVEAKIDNENSLIKVTGGIIRDKGAAGVRKTLKMMNNGDGWVVDIYLANFFDAVDLKC